LYPDKPAAQPLHQLILTHEACRRKPFPLTPALDAHAHLAIFHAQGMAGDEVEFERASGPAGGASRQVIGELERWGVAGRWRGADESAGLRLGRLLPPCGGAGSDVHDELLADDSAHPAIPEGC